MEKVFHFDVAEFREERIKRVSAEAEELKKQGIWIDSENCSAAHYQEAVEKAYAAASIDDNRVYIAFLAAAQHTHFTGDDRAFKRFTTIVDNLKANNQVVWSYRLELRLHHDADYWVYMDYVKHPSEIVWERFFVRKCKHN